MSETEPRDRGQEVSTAVVRVLAGGGGGLVGFLVGGPVGAFLGGAASPAVESAVEEAWRKRVGRSDLALRAAAASANEDVASLVERIGDDVQRQELLLRVLQAAGAGTLPSKIVALGRVLAAGLNDDAVDESFILAGALAEMEAPHVQVLRILNMANGAPVTGLPDLNWWLPDHILQRLPGYSVVLPAVLQTLGRHGLVRNPPQSAWIGQGEDPVGITPLGHRCLALIPLDRSQQA
jgi:hypothetical protein